MEQRRRACVLCGNVHARTAYSDFQWSEGRLAKCVYCVRGRPQPEQPQPSAGSRVALAARNAAISMSRGVASEGLHQSASGLVENTRPCAAKWYRDMPLSYEDEGMPVALGDRSLLRVDMTVAERANRVIAQWKAMRLSTDVEVRLATTQVMQIASGPRAGSSRCCC